MRIGAAHEQPLLDQRLEPPQRGRRRYCGGNAQAGERKVGGGTRGAAGRRRRDTFASLKKTCRELGVCFWNYLRGRAAGPARIPRRGALLRARAAARAAGGVPAVPAWGVASTAAPQGDRPGAQGAVARRGPTEDYSPG